MCVCQLFCVLSVVLNAFAIAVCLENELVDVMVQLNLNWSLTIPYLLWLCDDSLCGGRLDILCMQPSSIVFTSLLSRYHLALNQVGETR